MANGRNCDNCETHLNDEDYVSYGSWSYTCPNCGFSYRHGLGVDEQLEKFNNQGDEKEDTASELAALRAENERLREALQAALDTAKIYHNMAHGGSGRDFDHCLEWRCNVLGKQVRAALEAK